MDNRYIGVFDSGLGGLTAVKELMTQMPGEGIIYFGDTARLPYGTRSDETIIKYVKDDINFLLTYDIKLIVAACGTASAVAVEKIRDGYEIEIVGVVEPAVKAAVNATKNGIIGIIGTPGTVNSGKYQREINKNNKNIKTVSVPCPLFVPLVENGHIDSEVAYLVAKEYLHSIKESGADTIIMGCTHYPLLKRIIYDIMDEKAALIDPGAETAKHVKGLLSSRNMLANEQKDRQYIFFASDLSPTFSRMGSLFLQRELDKIEKIDIDNF